MAGSLLRRFLPAGGCKGLTKQSAPCQGKNVFENGFCKHHGGAGKSLVQRRLELSIQDALRKSERFRKRFAKWERRNPELRRAMEVIRARKHEEKQ